MKADWIVMDGEFIAEKVSTVPSPFISTYEARLIYAQDTDMLYFGSDSRWVECGMPKGTKMWFGQVAAPTGWTIDDSGSPSASDCLLSVKANNLKTSGTNSHIVANHLRDNTKNFSTLGVVEGDFVWNLTDGTDAQVTAIDANDTLRLDTDIFPAPAGDNYQIGSAYNVAGGNLSGSWTTPGHVLSKAEIPKHTHEYIHRWKLDTFDDNGSATWHGDDTSGNYTGDGTANGVGNYPTYGGAYAHNHGAGSRPYAFIGIIAVKS